MEMNTGGADRRPPKTLFTLSKTQKVPNKYRTIRTRDAVASVLVEPIGVEPTTSCVQSRRSPN